MVTLSGTLSPGAVAEREPFDSGKANFMVKVGGIVSPYRIVMSTALPGTIIAIAAKNERASSYALSTVDGFDMLEARDEGYFKVRTPDRPGAYTLRLTDVVSGDDVLIRHFVLVPASQVSKGRLNGYRIGSYPKRKVAKNVVYAPPAGFIEVTRKTAPLSVSPHFTLGQFASKQAVKRGPKYLVLRPLLIQKLEHLLEIVNAHGWYAPSFVVMSGYRTPFYNRAIGNVTYSRHVFGGAADIYIDASPVDGRMDDLNGDGRVDKGDAAALYNLIHAQRDKQIYASFVGGLGEYGSTRAHGPFVHIDVRGITARWGR